MRRLCRLAAGFLLLSVAAVRSLVAQQAVTITGHVSSANMPVRGATVRIDSLALGATTDADGRYSFIIPSTRVRGQTVTLVARYPRFRAATALVTLTGGSLLRDFELVSGDDAPVGRPAPTSPAPRNPVNPRGEVPRTGTEVARSAPPMERSTARMAAIAPASAAVSLDSSVFVDLSGLTDVPSALAGRVAGLNVESSSAPGGTVKVLIRGEHSVAGLTQPLVVIDGVIADNSNITSDLQRSGQGGFDYGTTFSDFNPEDVASVEVLRGPEATMRYGGRAANGVIIVSTRNARGLRGFTIAANQQISSVSIIRRPVYQNSYGQGLNGAFSFFDGKGGGVNDATDQSWGPALDGAPRAQASYAEVGRADVRAFTAQPGNIDSYFTSARALATNVSMQGGSETAHLRGAISNRTSDGTTPETSLTRRSIVLNGDVQASARLSLEGALHYYNDRGEDRPGSGFDESNTVSTFSHTPRQVDFGVYKIRLRDLANAQFSWNYAGRNNPWFAALVNDNHDERSRYLAGGTASFAVTDVTTALVRGGVDHSSDNRQFLVGSGWMGGYPDYFGRGDFSTGGSENDDITHTRSNVDVALRIAPHATGSTAFAFTAGGGIRSENLDMAITVADKGDGSGTTSSNWTGSSTTSLLFGGVNASVRDAFAFSATARYENLSLGAGSSSATLYPALLASVDLARLDSAPREGRLNSFVIRGGWSKSGNAPTPELLQRLGFTAASTSAVLGQVINPEETTGFEAGVTARAFSNRVSADVTFYSEKSDNLALPISGGFARTAALTNRGIEASLGLSSIKLSSSTSMSIRGTISKNNNSIDALSGGAGTYSLAPAVGGVSVVARTGSSLGTILGTKYLRGAAGELLLRDGHPLPDSIAGPVVLGQSAPSWIGGLSAALTREGFEVSGLLDVHHGGSVFSASNRAGAISGVLDETAFRPDSGLLVTGTDVGGGANTKHVTTENYYHSLAGIGERWVYDASFIKLREARITYTLPLQFISSLKAQSARISLIGRNLALWTNVPNIDPETVLSTSTLRGAELGQLPSIRSVGFQFSITP